MSILRKIFGMTSQGTSPEEKIASQVALNYSRISAQHPEWSPKQIVESMGDSFGGMPVYSIGLCACVCMLTERETGADPRRIYMDKRMQRMNIGYQESNKSEILEDPIEVIKRTLLAGGVSIEVLNPN